MASRIHQFLLENYKLDVRNGILDATFFRDDFRRNDNPLIPSSTKLDFTIEGKNVILIDDVLYTGRTIRSGMDAMLAYGRPAKVELLVLIDRQFGRHVPIQPDYTGLRVDTIEEQRVNVEWQESDGKDKAILFTT